MTRNAVSQHAINVFSRKRFANAESVGKLRGRIVDGVSYASQDQNEECWEPWKHWLDPLAGEMEKAKKPKSLGLMWEFGNNIR
jgi:hypothetical protein